MTSQPCTSWRPVALALAFGLCAAGAEAQDYVRADCRAHIAGDAPPAADSLTGRWYRRFWTGECSGLSGCFSGSPNWNGVVGDLAARSAGPQRAAVLARACSLGSLIGLEWTRPRAVRRIDSGDLRAFKAALASSRDVMSGLMAVEAQARAKIAKGGNPQ